MKTTRKRGLWILGLLALLAVAVLLKPERVPVEVAPVTRGPLVVTVDASARTRVRVRRVIVAPANGHLERIERRAGDAVGAGDVIARLGAPSSAPLDPRTRADLEARLASTVATAEEATAAVRRAAMSQEHAERELARARPLIEAQVIARQAFDDAEFEHEARGAELRAAELARETAGRNVAVARAQLMRLDDAIVRPAAANASGDAWVRAPADGRVLRVLCESEGPVQAGTPLLELGDPSSLEVVAEVLTADAVVIPPGASVTFERWGGVEPLRGKVRLVEPSAFTKVSALGVEEQRVNVIIDPDGGAGAWAKLGDGYRLEARIAVWEAETVKVPLAALARDASGWSAFVIHGGQAQLRRVDVGRRALGEAQVRGGLVPSDLVALHPSSSVRDGARVAVAR
jgi:HlyD family secretion protein